jgi:alpha-glucosidase/alpha-D-xyloside xylohydrolase
VDLATMPIYVRAGAIIPVDPVRQYTAQTVSEPTTIRIYGGTDGEYTLYDDDGVRQQYVGRTGGWTRFTWNDRTRQIPIEPGAPTAAKNVVGDRVFRLLLLPEGITRELRYTGRRGRTNLAGSQGIKPR